MQEGIPAESNPVPKRFMRPKAMKEPDKPAVWLWGMLKKAQVPNARRKKTCIRLWEAIFPACTGLSWHGQSSGKVSSYDFDRQSWNVSRCNWKAFFWPKIELGSIFPNCRKTGFEGMHVRPVTERPYRRRLEESWPSQAGFDLSKVGR
jgi:hypothetical protein